MKSIFSSLLSSACLFISLHLPAQTWQWVLEEPTAIGEGWGLSTDNAGNAVLVGIASGTLGTATATGVMSSGAAAKYDANGNLVWSWLIPHVSFNNVSCDAAGNAFVVGYVQDTAIIGTQTLIPQGGDMLVVKFSPAGIPLFAANFGGTGLETVRSVTVDAQGDVVICGYVGTTSFSFGSSAITCTGGTVYFIGKLTSSGVPLWATTAADGSSVGYDVTTDSNSNIYMCGYYSGTCAVGASSLYSAGSTDLLLAKFSAAGLPLWGITGGGVLSDPAYCVRIHPSGDIFVSGGYTSPTFSFGTTVSGNAGGYDMFVARVSPSGAVQWVTKGGGSITEIGYSIATHANGVYVSSSFSSPTMTLGTSTLTAPSGFDNMFFAGLDNSGNVTYLEGINGGGDDVMALAMYNGCDLYLGGDIWTPTLTLGTFTVTHPTSEVLFLAKFNTGINSPTLNVTPSFTLCAGNTATLSATGATSYTWTGGPNTSTYVVTPTVNTQYVIAGTSSLGCSTKTSVNVAIAPNTVSFSVLTGTPFCNGNTATLAVLGASTASWSTGSFSTTVYVTPSVNTVYTVSGDAATGCYYNTTQTIPVVANTPVTVAASKTLVCKGGAASFTASGADSYSWNSGQQQPVITVTPSANYTFIVTGTGTLNGCVTSASVQVKVVNCAGVDAQEALTSLEIFPNPAQGAFEVRTSGDFEGITIFIQDISGAVVQKATLTQQVTRIDSQLPPGVYFLSVGRESQLRLVTKLIMQ